MSQHKIGNEGYICHFHLFKQILKDMNGQKVNLASYLFSLLSKGCFKQVHLIGHDEEKKKIDVKDVKL